MIATKDNLLVTKVNMIVVRVVDIITNLHLIRVVQQLIVVSTMIPLDLRVAVIITRRILEIIEEEAPAAALILVVAVLAIKRGRIVKEAILAVIEKDHPDHLRSRVCCMNKNNSIDTQLSKRDITHLIEAIKIMGNTVNKR